MKKHAVIKEDNIMEGGLEIVLVESNRYSHDTMVQIVEGMGGYSKLEVFRDHRKAWEHLEKHSADVIITNLGYCYVEGDPASEFSGLDLLLVSPDVPVRLLVTGAGLDFGEVYADMGIHIMRKPFSPEQFVRYVKGIMHSAILGSGG